MEKKANDDEFHVFFDQMLNVFLLTDDGTAIIQWMIHEKVLPSPNLPLSVSAFLQEGESTVREPSEADVRENVIIKHASKNIRNVKENETYQDNRHIKSVKSVSIVLKLYSQSHMSAVQGGS